jgi:hypothetical protein
MATALRSPCPRIGVHDLLTMAVAGPGRARRWEGFSRFPAAWITSAILAVTVKPGLPGGNVANGRDLRSPA